MERVGDPAALNGHIVGIVLKELVRRAIMAIRNERQAFAVMEKEGYFGKGSDVYTSADRSAQEVYLKSLRECFPDYGIVAEEDALSIEPKNGTTAFFTVDPLDGTEGLHQAAVTRDRHHGRTGRSRPSAVGLCGHPFVFCGRLSHRALRP